MLRAVPRSLRRAAEASIPIRLRNRGALLARRALVTLPTTTATARVGGVGRVGARRRALGEDGTTHRHGEEHRERAERDASELGLLRTVGGIIFALLLRSTPGHHLLSSAPAGASLLAHFLTLRRRNIRNSSPPSSPAKQPPGQLQGLAEPTAELAGPARVLTQLASFHHDRLESSPSPKQQLCNRQHVRCCLV
jgi:hypothetical protein